MNKKLRSITLIIVALLFISASSVCCATTDNTAAIEEELQLFLAANNGQMPEGGIMPRTAIYPLYGITFTRSFLTQKLSRSNGCTASVTFNGIISGNNPICISVVDYKTQHVITSTSIPANERRVISWTPEELSGYSDVCVFFTTFKDSTQTISGSITY